MDLQPGQSVTITVTSKAIKASSQKTLARLFTKDPAISATRLTARKPFTERIRAGRFWRHTRRGSASVIPAQGDSATITTTLDIIRDIQSVANYVDVK